MIGTFKFEIEGIHETINKMDFTTRKTNDSANTALREGAEAYRNEIERNTPVDSGEAQSKVMKGNVTTSGSYKSVKIGYHPDVAWRMWFLEEGTYDKSAGGKGITPMKIVEKSKENKDQAVERIVADFIRQAIASL